MLLSESVSFASGDCIVGTCVSAGTAIYTLISVDHILAVAFGDRIVRTLISAGAA